MIENINLIDANELKKSLDQLWCHYYKSYKEDPNEYDRGRMNVVLEIKRDIDQLVNKNVEGNRHIECAEFLEELKKGLGSI